MLCTSACGTPPVWASLASASKLLERPVLVLCGALNVERLGERLGDLPQDNRLGRRWLRVSKSKSLGSSTSLLSSSWTFVLFLPIVAPGPGLGASPSRVSRTSCPSLEERGRAPNRSPGRPPDRLLRLGVMYAAMSPLVTGLLSFRRERTKRSTLSTNPLESEGKWRCSADQAVRPPHVLN